MAPSAASSSRADPGGLLPGSVVSVRMCNFVTYTDAKFEPGPRLNLILGPNGSGKSTLVAGLVIGLNGSIEHIGRAKDLKAYIKHGCSWASIEIELRGQPGEPNKIVKRMIQPTESRKDASSTWSINGEKATAKAVKDLTAALNIQVDNLCQCLPQDRVAAFSRMSARDLLRETQTAADPELATSHQELIDFNKTHANDAKNIKKDEERLETLRAEQERSQREVDKIEQHRQIKDEIELCRKKLPWVVYEEKRKLALQDKERAAAAKLVLDAAKRDLDAATLPYNEARQGHAAAEAAVKAKEKRMRELGEKHERADRSLRDKETALEQADKARKAEEQGREKRRRDAERHQAEVAKLEGALAALPSAEQSAQQWDQLAAAETALKRKLREQQEKTKELDGRLRPLAEQRNGIEGRLRELSQARNNRLRRLFGDRRMQGRNLEQQTKWVEENRDRFTGPVYGPLGAEIEVPNDYVARVAERQISPNLFASWVVSNREDKQLLIQNLGKVEIYMPNRPGELQPIAVPSSAFHEFGVQGYLEELLGIPPLVAGVLRDMSNIHNVIVCSEEVEQGQTVERLRDALAEWHVKLNSIYSPVHRYGITYSRYDSSTMKETTILQRDVRILIRSADQNAKAELERELAGVRAEEEDLQKQMKGVEEKLREVQSELSRVTARREEVRVGRAKRLEVERKIKAGRKQVEDLLRERDEGSERERCEAAYLAAASAKGAAVASLVAALAEARAAAAGLAGLQLAEKQLAERVGRLQNERRHAEAAHQRAENDHKAARDRFQESKNVAVALHARAKEVCVLEDNEELRERMTTLPDNPRELEELIESKEREARALLPNDRVLQEHAKRAEEILALVDRVEAERQRLADGNRYFETLRDKWLPSVRELVARIHAEFDRRFRSLGCVGQVQLHEEGEEYDKYGIDILTKFRDDERLARLDAMRQSGGERSVSTMIYLMSLQALTHCPFRVVDEINQGMDATNERRVFGMLVETASQPGPQYFLVTPKLLSGLPYGEAVTALFVTRGPGLALGWPNWSLPGFLQQRQRLSGGTAVSEDPDAMEADAARAAAAARARGKRPRHE